MLSSSSDEEDGYLGTKRLRNLQEKFINFYEAKKIDESDDEDEPLVTKNWTPVKNIPTAKATTSSVETIKTTHRSKEASDNNSIIILSNDESSSANLYNLTSQSKTDTSVVIDLIDTSNKLTNTDNVLQQLDDLAESAKELADDYNAALYGRSRKNKRVKTSEVTAVPEKTCSGRKRPRETRKSVRLQQKKAKCSFSRDQNAIINLNSSSDEDTSVNCKKTKEIETVNKNPKVQCNVNWRCDSEITHKITVFKFQCLSCIEDFCCEEYNIDHRLVLFTIDDKPVDLKEHCYASLRLTESAVIDAGVLPENYLHIERPKMAKGLGLIRLKVQYEQRSKTKDFPIHLRKTDSCEIIYWLIIKQLGCDVEEILLKYDGQGVKVTDTMHSLELEEDDCLDLTLI